MEDQDLAREHLEIDKRRLQLDEKRARFDQRFWHRNFGTMTTFSVAFLGLVLSVAQIWVAYVQRDREALQKEHEIKLAQIQKGRELESQERRDLRDFVAKNESLIFSKDSGERDKMRKLMLATFTPEIVQPVFDSLLTTAPAAERSTWAVAHDEAVSVAREQAKPQVYVHYQAKADEQLAEGVLKMLKDAGYRVPGKQLVVQKTNGDVRYFHTDERDLAATIATKVHDYLKQQGRDQAMSPMSAGQSFPNEPRGLFEVWIPASAR